MPTHIILYVRFFIAICFVILSACVLYFKDVSGLSKFQSYAFSGLLFIYGLFRIYRAWKVMKDELAN